MHRITRSDFDSIKSYGRWHTSKQVVRKFGIHLSTAINIRGSKDYIAYRELVKAEHPETIFSLRDQILELHDTIFNLKDNKYIAPVIARTAIQEIQIWASKNTSL